MFSFLRKIQPCLTSKSSSFAARLSHEALKAIIMVALFVSDDVTP